MAVLLEMSLALLWLLLLPLTALELFPLLLLPLLLLLLLLKLFSILILTNSLPMILASHCPQPIFSKTQPVIMSPGSKAAMINLRCLDKERLPKAGTCWIKYPVKWRIGSGPSLSKMLAILFGVIWDAAAMPSGEDVESNIFSSLEESFLAGFLFCLALAAAAAAKASSASACGGGDSEFTVLVSLCGGLSEAEYEFDDSGRDIDERLFLSAVLSELVRLSKLWICGVVPLLVVVLLMLLMLLLANMPWWAMLLGAPSATPLPLDPGVSTEGAYMSDSKNFVEWNKLAEMCVLFQIEVARLTFRVGPFWTYRDLSWRVVSGFLF